MTLDQTDVPKWRQHGPIAQRESTCLADKGSRVQIPLGPQGKDGRAVMQLSRKQCSESYRGFDSLSFRQIGSVAEW